MRMMTGSPSLDKAKQTQKRPGARTVVSRLYRRAENAYREGGIRLVSLRFRRWFNHQWQRTFPSRAYQRWIARQEPSAEELDRQTAWAQAVTDRPVISIVCPLYQTPIPILQATIDSVREQSYPRWEMCLTLADDESAELRDFVQSQVKRDSRIVIASVPENGGISASTNAAINVAAGEWIAFLDHDDLLAKNALYEVARHITDTPDCDLVYTDEDLLSANGRRRRSPVLKPDWSPEMLLHFNYICHFVVARTTLVRSLGGLRGEYDGAQDWDFLLRFCEVSQRIHHLPKVLYHWREVASSTAASQDAKPYVVNAQKRTLEDAFRRKGIEAQVSTGRFGHLYPDWMSPGNPTVSVVIPTKNQPGFLKQVCRGIFEQTADSDIELILVDNNSSNEETLAFYRELEKRSNVRISEYPKTFNYSAACNRGASQATGEFLLFLNNDIEIRQANWLHELLKWGGFPEVGMVGPHLSYPDGRTQHAGIVLGLFDLAGHSFHQTPPETYSAFGMAEWVRNVSAVTGACQLIKRNLFESLNGYDEGYRLLYSDIELCLRVRQRGLRVVYTPHSRLIHHECATRDSSNRHAADAVRFARALAEFGIERDPFYHPALSARSRTPQLQPDGAENIEKNLCRLVANLPARADAREVNRRAA